jgi:hypothetical protein
MGIHRFPTYRLLGHERITLTRDQVERMVRGGLLGLDTKVICDDEGFAVAISTRPEFRNLVPRCPKNPPSGDADG